MRVLIDTHAFLWFFSNSTKLSARTRDIIEDDASKTFLNIASLWEISIKNSTGKLSIDGGFESVAEVLSDNEIQILAINFSHTARQNTLPFHHRDPFDRMIAAQALVEEIDLVSADDVFDSYFDGSEVKRIW